MCGSVNELAILLMTQANIGDRQLTMTSQPKIIVLDDDPTGSQTVHSCLLLTQWDVPTLKLGLTDTVSIFFILTNTRAMTPTQAAAVTQEVCRNLKIALAELNLTDFLVVSRSDSTLRGHYPIETDVIAAQLGGFDAHFLMPAFFEGGRITRDSIHYLIVDGVETPVHKTEFARDSVFAYSHSYLPDYVAEKTHGQIPADRVVQFLLAEVRTGSLDRLMQLERNRCCVVDGEQQSDFDRFAADILEAVSQGQKVPVSQWGEYSDFSSQFRPPTDSRPGDVQIRPRWQTRRNYCRLSCQKNYRPINPASQSARNCRCRNRCLTTHHRKCRHESWTTGIDLGANSQHPRRWQYPSDLHQSSRTHLR